MNIKYYLLILQLEAYRIGRFFLWLQTHYQPFAKNPGKEPKWTPKAKLIYRLAWAWFGIIAIWSLVKFSFLVALLLLAAVWVHSFILLILAVAVIKPYEVTNRLRVKWFIRRKILSLTKLKVIGITGSYGKTSTKMCLQPLLTNALMTPKSYNTMFGIYKVVDYELSASFNYFICEMGAYKIGDIKEFCDITVPHLGILTGINEQHLERFGSIENTICAKFEILQNLRAGGIGVANLDNRLVRENLHRANVPVIGYSVEGFSSDRCKELVSVTSWKIEHNHTVFELQLGGKTYQGKTPLLGKGHLSNVVASIVCATQLGEPIEAVLAKAAKLNQIPHRLERRVGAGITILDNTYSSNPDGFREALSVLQSFPSHRILVTPGIVELGEELEKIHVQLGTNAAESCDEIVLVGDSRQTKALREGLSKAGFPEASLTQLASRSEVPGLLASRTNSGAVFLLENDLPDHYI